MGLGRPPVRDLDHVVSDRRRFLHRLYGHRRAGRRLRRRRLRLFRAALHDRRLSVRLRRHAAPVEGGQGQQLRHRGGRGARSLRLTGARTRRRRDGRPRHHALHRAPADRHGRRHQGAGLRRPGIRRRDSADRRLCHPGALHLFGRAACAGAHRLRQGHHDLHRGDRGGDHRTDQARRLRRRLRGGRGGLRGEEGRQPPPSRSLHHPLCDARVRLGAGGLHVSAHADGHIRQQERRHDPQERDPPAGLYAAARPARAARLHGPGARPQAHEQQRRRAGAVQQRLLPAGSRASPSRRSPSAPWCPPR